MVNCSKFWENDNGWSYCNCSYEDLLDHEIIYSKAFGYYQGDILVILKNEDKYGFTIIGYGSCSGCDALQACGNVEELQMLSDQINASVNWGTKEEIMTILKDEELLQGKHWFSYYDELNFDEIEKVLKND